MPDDLPPPSGGASLGRHGSWSAGTQAAGLRAKGIILSCRQTQARVGALCVCDLAFNLHIRAAGARLQHTGSGG